MTLFMRRSLGGALIAVAALWISVEHHPAEAQSIGPSDRAEIEMIVREYLREHPEIIVESLEILQAREEADAAELQRLQLVERADEIFNAPSTPVLGNPDGDVTLVEFFDYQCGYCKRVLDVVYDLKEEDGNLRVVFKEFPILGPASVTAARASLASQEQGLYSEFHHALMAYRGTMSDDVIFGLAEDVGLDVDQLRTDMESPEISAEISANLSLAQAIGIRGTPAFVIGDRVIPGAVGADVLERLIAEERQG